MLQWGLSTWWKHKPLFRYKRYLAKRLKLANSGYKTSGIGHWGVPLRTLKQIQANKAMESVGGWDAASASAPKEATAPWGELVCAQITLNTPLSYGWKQDPAEHLQSVIGKLPVPSWCKQDGGKCVLFLGQARCPLAGNGSFWPGWHLVNSLQIANRTKAQRPQSCREWAMERWLGARDRWERPIVQLCPQLGKSTLTHKETKRCIFMLIGKKILKKILHQEVFSSRAGKQKAWSLGWKIQVEALALPVTGSVISEQYVYLSEPHFYPVWNVE